MEASGLRLGVGNGCTVLMPNGNNVEAEVVGFHGDRPLMPANDVRGLSPGAKVIPWDHAGLRLCPATPASGAAGPQIRLEDFCGRRVIGQGGRWSRPPVGRSRPLKAEHYAPLTNQPINPLDREPISEVLDVGVRAINALLTVGRGQRMGLFAGSGVGKSVLLGMMARYTSADVIVVGLIGERGREVKDFIEQILGPEIGSLRRGCGAGRYLAAGQAAGRFLCNVHRGIFSGSGQECVADHGFPYPLRDGAA